MPSKAWGLLDVETVMTADKTLTAVTGTDVATGTSFAGYEMHVGRTTGPACSNSMIRFADGSFDGAASPDGRVSGAYIHGLFTDDAQRARWLERLSAAPSELDYDADVEATLDALADHLEAHIDCDRLLALARVPTLQPRALSQRTSSTDARGGLRVHFSK